MSRGIIALLLGSAYAAVIVAMVGVQPGDGFPLWFFAAAFTAVGALLLARVATAFLPAPWRMGNTGGAPPRTVQLSWSATFSVPIIVPVAFFPWYYLGILRHHAYTRAMAFVVVLLLAWLVVRGILNRVGDYTLLRDGDLTDAIVDDVRRDRYGNLTVTYRFDAPNGESITGRSVQPPPVPDLGRAIPVYFDRTNPRRHVLAGAGWFEAS